MEYITLKEVCEITMGQSPDSNSYNDNGEGRFFKEMQILVIDIRLPQVVYCTNKNAKPEDILISVRAPIGAMNYAKEDCCIGQD